MTGRIEVKIEDIVPNRIYLIVKGSKKYLASHNGVLFVRIQGLHVSLKAYRFNFDTVEAEGGKVYESITSEQQFLKYCFSACCLNPSLETISHLFTAQAKSNNLVYEIKSPFPKEGSNTDSIKEIVDYLTIVKGYSAPDKLKSEVKGIGWNMSTCWYLANPKASTKLLYTKEQLFITNMGKPTPIFQEGKWYKNLGSDGSLIGKFKCFSDDNRHFMCYEYISSEGKYCNTPEGGPLTRTFNNAEEISVQEIQQYLPDDHEDKIKTASPENKYDKIFEEACKKYPIGTVFKVVHDQSMICTVVSHEKTKDWHVINHGHYINLHIQAHKGAKTDSACVWHDEKWAEVVKEEPKTHKIAVKFSSKEESAHILKHFNPREIEIPDTSGWMCLDDGMWNPGWALLDRHGYTQLSFDDWCKEYNHPYKTERYLATMKFFEQLSEPERSEAISNYDEHYSINTPKSLYEALGFGFEWSETKQKQPYWSNINRQLRENTYFKEELVLGKYKVGDIVVSIEKRFDFRQIGDMFKVLETSSKDALYYGEELRNGEPSTWRLATPEEVEAYNQGVRNIADIKSKSKEFVLPAKWCLKVNPDIIDDLIKWSGSSYRLGHMWMCSNKQWFDKGVPSEQVKEITYEQFKEYVLSEPIFKPAGSKEAVHCTTREEWDFVLSKFNPMNLRRELWEEYYHNSYINTDKGSFGNIHGEGKTYQSILNFKQWCDKYGHSYSEYLLNVASITYPVGTKYFCAHSLHRTGVIRDKFKYYGDIDFITDGSGGSVYYKGKWAKVIDNSIVSKTDFSKAKFLPSTENEWKPIAYDLRGATFAVSPLGGSLQSAQGIEPLSNPFLKQGGSIGIIGNPCSEITLGNTIGKLPYWTASSINSKSIPSLYNPDVLIPLSTSGLVSFKELPKLL